MRFIFFSLLFKPFMVDIFDLREWHFSVVRPRPWAGPVHSSCSSFCRSRFFLFVGGVPSLGWAPLFTSETLAGYPEDASLYLAAGWKSAGLSRVMVRESLWQSRSEDQRWRRRFSVRAMADADAEGTRDWRILSEEDVESGMGTNKKHWVS